MVFLLTQLCLCAGFSVKYLVRLKVTFCSSTVLHFIHYLLSFPRLLPFPLLIACSLTILQLIPFFSYIFGSLYKFASVGLKIHILFSLHNLILTYPHKCMVRDEITTPTVG